MFPWPLAIVLVGILFMLFAVVGHYMRRRFGRPVGDDDDIELVLPSSAGFRGNAAGT